jgi:hypothetical protein
MYNVSDCNQKLTSEIIDNIKNLYSIDNLPDLHFEELNVSKNNNYMGFNAKIINKGLKEAKRVLLNVNSDNKINSFAIGDINYGEGKIINVEDVYIGNDRELNFTLSTFYDLNKSDNSEYVYL